MSHTTEADYKKQLEELRELHRQAVEDTQKAHDHRSPGPGTKPKGSG